MAFTSQKLATISVIPLKLVGLRSFFQRPSADFGLVGLAKTSVN